MSEQDVRQLAEQFVERLHRVEEGGPEKVDELVALFADGAELVNPELERRGERARGRDGVRRFWESYRASFRNIHSDFGAITTDGEAAGLFWRSEGVDAKGKNINYAGATLLRFDVEGKIRNFRGYFDSRALT